LERGQIGTTLIGRRRPLGGTTGAGLEEPTVGKLTRVALVHPYPDYRARVHRLLVGAGFRVVGEATTAAGGRVMLRDCPPDVLVISKCVGDVAGVIREARAAGIKVLVLTMGPDDQFVVDMMLAGATGLICDCNLPELPDAVRGVLIGSVPVPMQLVKGVMDECRQRLEVQDPHSPWVRLSERQREVMELLRRGYDTHSVGEELGLQPATVRAHVAAAMHKLGVRTRAEALAVLASHETPQVPTPSPLHRPAV
jgi:DNA-binding NarL/FixJ family response regulator